MFYYTMTCPLGKLYLYQTNNYITDITLTKIDNDALYQRTPLIINAIEELEEYFSRTRKTFTFDFLAMGTDFECAIYQELLDVEYGDTISYKTLGNQAGYKDASRAVGNAMNKNRLMIVVPCHRVINHNGKIGNYAYGSKMKEFLLDLEKE